MLYTIEFSNGQKDTLYVESNEEITIDVVEDIVTISLKGNELGRYDKADVVDIYNVDEPMKSPDILKPNIQLKSNK